MQNMHKTIFLTSAQQVLPLLSQKRLLPYNQTLLFYLDSNKSLVYRKIKKSLALAPIKLSSKDLFEPAIVFQAKYIIICQIRPVGDVEPTAFDATLAETANHISKYLGIQLLDYLIVSAKDYYSRKEDFLLNKLNAEKQPLRYVFNS